MVDRETRDILAEALRQFAGERITGEQFLERDKATSGSKDRAVIEFSCEMELAAEDVYKKRLTPSRKERKEAARWALFLQTDQEYEWPPVASGLTILVLFVLSGFSLYWLCNLGVCGLLGPTAVVTGFCLRGWFESRVWAKAGDKHFWPFLHEADFVEAKKRPRLLAGSCLNSQGGR